jgi:hypothetical protein
MPSMSGEVETGEAARWQSCPLETRGRTGAAYDTL